VGAFSKSGRVLMYACIYTFGNEASMFEKKYEINKEKIQFISYEFQYFLIYKHVNYAIIHEYIIVISPLYKEFSLF
jgi:hypothetical protein